MWLVLTPGLSLPQFGQPQGIAPTRSTMRASVGVTACPYPGLVITPGLSLPLFGQPQGIAPTGIDPHPISMDYFQYTLRCGHNLLHPESHVHNNCVATISRPENC